MSVRIRSLLLALSLGVAPGMAGAQLQSVFFDGFDFHTLHAWIPSEDSEDCIHFGFQENFTWPNGSNWPAPWSVVDGDGVVDVQGGMGRLTADSADGPVVFADVDHDHLAAQLAFRIETTGTARYVLWLRHGETAGGHAIGLAIETGVELSMTLLRKTNGVISVLHPETSTLAPFIPGARYRLELLVIYEWEPSTDLSVRARVGAADGPLPLVGIEATTPAWFSAGEYGIRLELGHESVLDGESVLRIDDFQVMDLCLEG